MPVQSGVYHQTYESDQQLRPTSLQRYRAALVIIVIVLLPFVADPIQMKWANNIIIAAIGAIGLNILVGYTGQISLGQGAFLAVGAYASGMLAVYLGMPWFFAVIVAAFITAGVGVIFGLPSLRLKGLYLAVATLAAQQVIEQIIKRWDPVDGQLNGRVGEALNIPAARLFGNPDWQLSTNAYAFYVVAMIILVLVVIVSVNLFRTHIGRAFVAIRDQDIAAEVMGVNVFGYKLLAFATSSFIVGLAGAMLAQNSTAISFERFTIDVSIEYLAMIIIGGLGSISGSIYGAVFVVILPEILSVVGRAIAGTDPAMISQMNDILPFAQRGAFGVAIVLVLILEPEGLVKIWRDIKDYFRLWPFSY